MHRHQLDLLLSIFFPFLLVIASCESLPNKDLTEHIRLTTKAVDDTKLTHADDHPQNWLTYGLNYAETRFSKLNQITADNIHQLGLVWSYQLGTQRGLEATPIVVDGVIYATGPWSVVYAIAARTGELIWSWDSEVPPHYAELACCDIVNRGVAVYKGRVYVGTLDGRLAAIDAATGTTIWETLTVDQSKAYTITGAPRIIKGMVIIGNGGAEYGVRGYVSAYDAEAGGLVWRTYTVPGDPSMPFESEAMKRAAETWHGQWWKYGGGGTVWDAMAYDPELNLLYIGTGNGSPWSRHHRSPGGGDNLYLSSILALNPSTGEMVWYYQTTPGDTWDYTATQHLILANLFIDGRARKVIMQAPKNGFFYVLDRENGEFISAEPYVEVTWTEGINSNTGRPIERPGSDYRHEAATVTPTTLGGHNWQPMAYNPMSGLVYIPAQNMNMRMAHDPDWQYHDDGRWNLGILFKDYVVEPGHLLAWNPVKQSEAWRVPYQSPWNGGVLTTAGNLVFQGTGDARFVAYDAATGEKLWETPTGTGIIGAPVTYLVDGIQYVTVMAGWGGAFGLSTSPAGDASNILQVGRIYTFALGGTAPPPEFTRINKQIPDISVEMFMSADEIGKGMALYTEYCQTCHGGNAASTGIIPDLRYSRQEIHDIYEKIILDGLFQYNGMPGFKDRLSVRDVNLIQAFIISKVDELRNLPRPIK